MLRACLSLVSCRLLSVQSENLALKAEHAQTVSQLSSQTDVVRSSFREQLRHVQDEHRATVETLQQQLGRLENQLFQLQKEPSASKGLRPAAPQQPHSPRGPGTHTHSLAQFSIAPLPWASQAHCTRWGTLHTYCTHISPGNTGPRSHGHHTYSHRLRDYWLQFNSTSLFPRAKYTGLDGGAPLLTTHTHLL